MREWHVRTQEREERHRDQAQALSHRLARLIQKANTNAMADAAAHELRPSPNTTDAQLLGTRRNEDRATRPALWTTTNVIQENIMRGGLHGRTPETNRRSTTRPVKSVGEDLRINRALWRLTEEMAKLKS